MKLPLKTQYWIIAVLLFTCSFFLSNCNRSDYGYTGTLTDSSALALTARCHFIPKALIEDWTARYQANKALICHDSLPGQNHVLGDSSSFNRCFIRAIINNASCIGLRVIYGMDTFKKVHIILVGIKPDYSTLYIPRPNECCPLTANERVMREIGGAEYAMEP